MKSGKIDKEYNAEEGKNWSLRRLNYTINE